MARRILWGTLVLTPVAILARFVFDLDETVLFILAAARADPARLADRRGDRARSRAHRPGVGGFLNASFGNAPELIIALFAVADGLPGVVRGSLTGSVVSNILLVLGAAMIAGGDGEVDARSLRWQLFAVFGAVGLIAIPSALSWGGGSHERHSLYLVSIPISASCSFATSRSPGRTCGSTGRRTRGSPPIGLVVPTLFTHARDATAATALVSEILVHSLGHFGKAVGLNEFFIAVVIVAIVGNAAEHGGAVVIARRGNTTLATEIAITSSMQVAVFVAPPSACSRGSSGVACLSPFRVIEIVTMAAAALFRRDRRLRTAGRAGGRASSWSASTAPSSSGTCSPSKPTA